MNITLREVRKLKFIEKVILHSHDQSLYLVSVLIAGEERYVTDNKGQLLKSFNKLELQTKFSDLEVGAVVLQQKSVYDEMIGLSEQSVDNTLEVSISGEAYAAQPEDVRKVH